ncbi:hypothetical protein DXG01_008037 [Tephrocybe rancida]|nr:hypothetical protein DXG01_008037 [Tephrocybe rancida]
MSYENNNLNSGSTGFGDSKTQHGGSQQHQGQGQGMSDLDSGIGGGQQYGQGNNTQGSNWKSSSNTDDQFSNTDRRGGSDQFGTSTGRDDFGSSGTDSYGSNTGMGGTGSGIGSGNNFDDDRNQGLGYGQSGQQGIGGHQGQKASMGDKMRGGVEKGIGKMTGKPELVEKGQERAVRRLLNIHLAMVLQDNVIDWSV